MNYEMGDSGNFMDDFYEFLQKFVIVEIIHA